MAGCFSAIYAGFVHRCLFWCVNPYSRVLTPLTSLRYSSRGRKRKLLLLDWKWKNSHHSRSRSHNYYLNFIYVIFLHTLVKRCCFIFFHLIINIRSFYKCAVVTYVSIELTWEQLTRGTGFFPAYVTVYISDSRANQSEWPNKVDVAKVKGTNPTIPCLGFCSFQNLLSLFLWWGCEEEEWGGIFSIFSWTSKIYFQSNWDIWSF